MLFFVFVFVLYICFITNNIDPLFYDY